MPALAQGSTVTVALIITLAGCVGPSKGSTVGPNLAAAPEFPIGCHANPGAIAYAARGPAAPASGVGCLHATTIDTYEPTIGIHPKTGHIMIYPHYGNSSLGPMSLGRSEDAGQTWRLLTPNIDGQASHPASLDPFLYLDPKTGRIFVDDLVTPQCSVLSFSDDEGQTWTNSVTPCSQGDHVNIFAGEPVVSTTIGYPNVLYRCGINTVAVLYGSFSSTCQKSINGGLAWTNTGSPAFVTDPTTPGIQGVPGWCDGGLGHGAAGPDGTVYQGKGLCGVPMVAVSRDEGATWQRSKISDLGMMVMFCNNYDHEVNTGVDRSGNVYAFWADNQRVPRLAISRDWGRTWGAAVDVRPPGVTQASMPQLAVGADGKVAMLYMGSTNAPTGPFPKKTEADPAHCQAGGSQDPAYAEVKWNAYITITTNALDDGPTFRTVTANDPAEPVVSGECGFRCPGFGDFIDLQLGPDGTPWAVFVKPCHGPDACARYGQGPGGPAVVGRFLGGPNLLEPGP